MFEQLFNLRAAVRFHRSAPLAHEREKFLLYLHQCGSCRTSLRSFAALLIQIVRFLRLKKLRDVKESEIENAARKWFKYRRPKIGPGPGPCTKPYFKWLAKRWLRFHGRLIPAPPPRVLLNVRFSTAFSARRLVGQPLSLPQPTPQKRSGWG